MAGLMGRKVFYLKFEDCWKDQSPPLTLAPPYNITVGTVLFSR